MEKSTINIQSALSLEQTEEDWSELMLCILSEMSCTTGTIHRLSAGSSNLLELVVQRGIPEVLMNKIQTIPVGKGIAGAAAERRDAVQLCNLQTDTSGVAKPDAKKTQVGGSLAVPILNGEVLVGTLGVGMREPHEFSEVETENLWAIARWLAPAIAKSGH
jgi:L-methionine (R)-S-oxide reductase